MQNSHSTKTKNSFQRFRNQSHEKARLWLALRRIRWPQAVMIYLRYWERLSIEEIAYVMDLNWDVVDLGINDGLVELKTLLSGLKSSTWSQNLEAA